MSLLRDFKKELPIINNDNRLFAGRVLKRGLFTTGTVNSGYYYHTSDGVGGGRGGVISGWMFKNTFCLIFVTVDRI